ncbi:SDR family NAD(P)-dependent oxidoreductase [Nocardioides marmoribigeumensis]|uniref:Short-subunit dehydrogenase n=1 Tax=Nocardioides marmoribigeumensis TaxID=433649 RepID=A0ABU2BSQ8_9ACTN|nr:SDR family oxidoreductase [Nocardioides marmoribigeumensis]MDR7361666.1 short-subunit dehydrogenase [Nocardioides marmoribigeumensis]
MSRVTHLSTRRAAESAAAGAHDPARPIALVTGPTAGIGLAFAHELARRGFDLVLVARSEDTLQDLAARLRTEHDVAVEVLAADLGDREQLARVEARLSDRSQPVDLLVNNAGFGLKEQFADNSVEEEQAMLDVLVVAVMRLSHAATTTMLERGFGGIINVSSVAGYLPRGTYGAAKAYVTRLSLWADGTYRERGVRTMALCPGFVRTEFHERMDVGRDSVPSWMWLDADKLVREALDDFDDGKALSVPDLRYKAVTAAARYVPTGLLTRFQTMGRR